MKRILSLSLLSLCLTGCCFGRLANFPCQAGGCGTMPGCGSCSSCPNRCDNFGFFRDMISCRNGCGEVYWNEWCNDPPDECDPCDACGTWTGPRCCPPRGLCNGWANLWGWRWTGGGCETGCSSCATASACSSCGHGDATGEVYESVPAPYHSPAPGMKTNDPFRDDPNQPTPAKPSTKPASYGRRVASVQPNMASQASPKGTATGPMLRPFSPAGHATQIR